MNKLTKEQIAKMPIKKVVKTLQVRHPDLKNLKHRGRGSRDVVWDAEDHANVANARDLLLEAEGLL